MSTVTEMLRGRVASGRGDLAGWMTRYRAAYRRAAGVELFPGSLNVVLEHEWRLPRDASLRLEPGEVGVGMTLVPCTVDEVPAFVARTDRNEAGTGHHPRTVVEVVAAVRLRDALGLSDGDTVEIVVPYPT